MKEQNNTNSKDGKVAIVTGSNTGLGYETALAFAKNGIRVIMACRNMDKAEAAKQTIIAKVPNADLDILQIDLSKLSSVKDFAKAFLAKYDRLDLLINNAGVMMTPYTKTEDGFELQMGANYFGHFLLTGLLLETIVNTPNARIVSLSSNSHRRGTIHFDDLHWEASYSAMGAYSQSKLACLMFAYELQRRLDKAGHKTLSLSAHPGLSTTDLTRYIPRWIYYVARFTLAPILAQSPAKGAQPTLMAALSDDVKGAEYFGPQGFGEWKGSAGRVDSTELAKNETTAQKLWGISEDLTGFKYL